MDALYTYPVLNARSLRRAGSRFAQSASVAVISFLALACPASAYGQDVADGKAVDDGLDSIVVTAEKRSVDVQAVPIAVSVMTGDSLDRSGISSTMELQTANPSLVVGAWGGFGQPYIRGIGSELISLGADSSTSVYLDGVYMARPGGTLQQLLDVDRIELLRGPQGTLYGRNSVGGSINIHSVQPSNELTGSADISYGNFNRIRVRGAVNVPLVDQSLFLRVSGITAHSKGYMTNLTPPAGFTAVGDAGALKSHYGNEDLTGARASLKWVVNPQLDVLLSVDGTRDRGTQSSTPRLSTDLPTSALPTGRVHPDPYTSYLNFDPVEKKDQWGASLTVRSDFGFAELKSITAYRKSIQDVTFDVDATDYDLYHERLYSNSETWTQELNLVSAGNGPLEWMVGAFYLDDSAVQDVPLFLNAGDFLLDFRGTLDTWAWALFAQGSYKVADRVKFTAGLRYSREQKTISVDHTAIIGGAPRATLLQVDEAKRRWSSWTPKFGVDIEVADDVMVYGSVTKGYKSGGFNLLSLDPTTFSFDPEYLWAYEVGLKSEWLDRRLRFNLSAFWYDHRARQEQVASAFGAVTDNAGVATIKGIEIESTARIARGWDVNLAYTYLDGQYDKFLTFDPDRPELGQLDLGQLGNRVPRAPKHAAVVSSTYRHELANGGSLTFFGEYSWKSRIFFDVYNEKRLSQGSLGLLSGRISYAPQSGPWSVSLWGRNLTNEVWYQTGIRSTAFFGSFRLVSEPRTYGVELSVRF